MPTFPTPQRDKHVAFPEHDHHGLQDGALRLRRPPRAGPVPYWVRSGPVHHSARPVSLPLRRNVSGQAAQGETFGVKMTGGGPAERAQCHLYADDRLVKTDIGKGSVDSSVSVP